jgi:hypothetical protein
MAGVAEQPTFNPPASAAVVVQLGRHGIILSRIVVAQPVSVRIIMKIGLHYATSAMIAQPCHNGFLQGLFSEFAAAVTCQDHEAETQH